MSIEHKVTQLEFPFLNQIRMSLYATKQRDDMKKLWEGHYRHDNEYRKGMRFGDFIADIWIKGGYAERFYKHEHHKYFYDSNQYT